MFSVLVNLDIIEGFMGVWLGVVDWIFRRRKWTENGVAQSEVENAVCHRASSHPRKNERHHRLCSDN